MGKRSRSTAPIATPVETLSYPPPRSVELEPEDWLWATWRSRTPRPWPEPRSFQREEALARLEQITANPQTRYHRWSEVIDSVALSSEEAQFWFFAITRVVPSLQEYEAVKRNLAIAPLNTPLTAEQVLAVLNTAFPYSAVPELIIPLVNLFSLPELMDLLSDDRLFQSQTITAQTWPTIIQGIPLPQLPPHTYTRTFDWRILHQLVQGFRRYILPYLSQAEVEALHPRLSSKLDPGSWTLPPSERAGLYLLAAALGMHEALLNLVATWTMADCQWDHHFVASEIIFGLNDPTLVEHHIRRLSRKLPPWQVRVWLAHTEHAALDYVQESLLDPDLARRVKVPEAAPLMLELTLSPRAAKAARQWLQNNLAQAIAGLIPTAVGSDTLAEAAIAFLRRMRRKGHDAYIRQCLADQAPDIASKVQKLVLDVEEIPALDANPDWWLPGEVPGKKAKLPTWLDVLELPPVQLGEFCLNLQQVADLLLALKHSPLNAPHPLVAALKTHGYAASLDRFAWRLFEIWLNEEAPSKENWAMAAVGLLGNDASVLKLAPLIREMPGEGHHKRAVLGLECLSAIGTDMALMQINAIAQKVKYKGLKTKAEDCILAIAQSRHLTPEQLEDRIVPDCGLDQRGSRIFDYGGRQFRFMFGSEMQPMVRDEDGKVLANLPKPKAKVKDDPMLAEQAIAEWKLLKKQIQEVTKTQCDRLEKAMISQRRWHPDEFDTFLVHHPLMTNLTQRLIWGVYEDSHLRQTFRVTEDLTCADESDRELPLPSHALASIPLATSVGTQGETSTLCPNGGSHRYIGLVHPAQLSLEMRGIWGELFSDYELIQPFNQISRTVFSLTAEELECQRIQRFQGTEVSVTTAMAILKKTGWSHTFKREDQTYYCKSFAFANVTAVIEHVPKSRFIYDDTHVTLNTCFFVQGLHSDGDLSYQPLLLKDVDPVVMSEVLRNVGAIAAKKQ